MQRNQLSSGQEGGTGPRRRGPPSACLSVLLNVASLTPAIATSSRRCFGFLCRPLTSKTTTAVAGEWLGDWGGSALDVGEEKTDPTRGRLSKSAGQLACLG